MAIRGVQFVSDSDGKKTAVLIDLRRYRRIWEDIHDAIVVESRKNEPRIPLEKVMRRLAARRKRRG